MTLQRFLDAQTGSYAGALAELKAGHKVGHWIWYILPQLASLGRSETARFYGIADLAEAQAYLAHPVLAPRLTTCAEALLSHKALTAQAILGPVDALKTRSCATLFLIASEGRLTVMQDILTRFYEDVPCPLTLAEMT